MLPSTCIAIAEALALVVTLDAPLGHTLTWRAPRCPDRPVEGANAPQAGGVRRC